MRSLVRISVGVVLGCLLLALPIHLWSANHAQILRIIYPLEAILAAPTLRCSTGAPGWLEQSARFSLWDNLSPAGQLVHVTPDGTAHECHYGWIGTPLLSEPVTEESRFRYASMSKLLTADLVLRQVKTGALSLDDRLLDLLPLSTDIRDIRLAQVTIEHLLRHSAGFDRLKSVDPMVVIEQQPWCPYEISPLAEVHLDFTPGQRYGYSNLNYCLLGVLLEKAAPRMESFRELIEQEYGLRKRGIRFIDGPYLNDEVSYDFRNSDFFGENYWRYFDFQALSSSAGLSGSALAWANLVVSLRQEDGFTLTQAAIQPICKVSAQQHCYGYSLYSYQPGSDLLRVYVQPGFLYGSPSLTIIDEYEGVTVWVGNGMRRNASSTEPMLKELYQALSRHYIGAG